LNRWITDARRRRSAIVTVFWQLRKSNGQNLTARSVGLTAQKARRRERSGGAGQVRIQACRVVVQNRLSATLAIPRLIIRNALLNNEFASEGRCGRFHFVVVSSPCAVYDSVSGGAKRRLNLYNPTHVRVANPEAVEARSMTKKRLSEGGAAKPPASRKANAQKPPPTWGVLKGKELHWPGATLLALLLEAANTRGLTMRALAEEHLGITYSHFMLLRRGQRAIPRLGEEVMGKIAHFLGLPRVVVMLAGGQLTMQDFFQDPKVLEDYLEPAMQFMQRDPELGPHMPPSAFTADIELRRYLVLLYEKATGKVLLPSRSSPHEILESFKDLETNSGT
jgi:hypothetical protein